MVSRPRSPHLDLILVFGIGRCGTTLVNRVLNDSTVGTSPPYFPFDC